MVRRRFGVVVDAANASRAASRVGPSSTPNCSPTPGSRSSSASTHSGSLSTASGTTAGARNPSSRPPLRCRRRPRSPSAPRCTCCPSTTRPTRPPTFYQLQELFGDRFELGVGLGYRDEEYDGVGLARNRRGRLMDAALDESRRGRPAGSTPPNVWVGGMAPAAIHRAAAPRTVPAAAPDAGAGRDRGDARGRGRWIGRGRPRARTGRHGQGHLDHRRDRGGQDASRNALLDVALPRVRRLVVDAPGPTSASCSRSCSTSRWPNRRHGHRRTARAGPRRAGPTGRHRPRHARLEHQQRRHPRSVPRPDGVDQRRGPPPAEPTDERGAGMRFGLVLDPAGLDQLVTEAVAAEQRRLRSRLGARVGLLSVAGRGRRACTAHLHDPRRHRARRPG